MKSNPAQGSALVEGDLPDAGHAIRYCDTGQAAAVVERETSDAGNSIRNRDGREAAAACKGAAPDANYRFGDGDRVHLDAAEETEIADAGDAFRNGDSCEAGALGKSVIGDAGNRAAFNGVGDSERPGGFGVTIGNGDFAASGGVCQVAQVCGVEWQDKKREEGKESCKVLHVSSTYHMASGNRSKRSCI